MNTIRAKAGMVDLCGGVWITVDRITEVVDFDTCCRVHVEGCHVDSFIVNATAGVVLNAIGRARKQRGAR